MDRIVFLLPFLSIIVTFFIGFFIFLKNSKKEENIFFFLMILTLTFWMSSNFIEDISTFSQYASFSVKLDFFFAPLASYFFYLFVQIFPQKKWRSIQERIFVFILALLLMVMPLFNSFLIKEVNFDNGSQIVFSNFIYLYGLVLTIILLGGYYIIYKTYQREEGIERKQTYYLLIGFLILIITVLISNLILPNIFTNYPLISRFGFLGVITFAVMCSYAILKHHLFDIRVILTETATILVLFALIAQILLSQSKGERLINIIVFLLVAYGGYLIIKSVQREIKQKEQLQELTMQLGQANSHLKELDEMKTEFVSLASHELLTPVSAIEGYLSMMLDEKLAKVEDPTAVRYMDRIYRSSRRLARLISDMLNISRIEEGRLLVEKKDVDLSELIKQVVDEIKFKADEKKQKVVFDPSFAKATEGKKSSWETYADPDKIKEVVVNLIGNSIKYSKEPGTITVTCKKVPRAMVDSTWKKIEDDIKSRPLDDQEAINSTIDPHFREILGDEQLLISVKDQGIGIPREELPRLFKKFHRVGDYTTAESQGTGLGLYISRALVELHHGRIWADSEGSGKGSTFTFSLPDISAKEQIIGLEKEIPQDKEQLKPLAKPMKASIDDKFENFPIEDEKMKEKNHKT